MAVSSLAGARCSLPDFLDANYLIEKVGLLGIWAIVFAESGLLIGFFLPGDALLFTAGFLASAPSSVDESLHLPLVPLILGIWFAAIVGDQVGYVFGQRVGPALFKRPDSRFFKQANVEKAHEFFEKHGPRAIVLARFVPDRAHVHADHRRRVARWSTAPSSAGTSSAARSGPSASRCSGYFLGQVEVIEQNLELAILTVVAISCLPIAFEVLKARREKRHSVVTDVAHDLLEPTSATSSTRPVTPTASSDGVASYSAPHKPVATSSQRRGTAGGAGVGA